MTLLHETGNFITNMTQTIQLLSKAIGGEFLSVEEGLFLYQNASTPLLQYAANEIRKQHHNDGMVTWIIDRNVNITNVCISRCKFCNFHRLVNQDGTYITSLDEYKPKIEQLFALGGNQILLQGGMHPKLKLDFYVSLFSSLKQAFPNIKLHALGPPEVVHLARLERCSVGEVLQALRAAGLDSLPGAGAEILSDRVRRELSPGKCLTQDWLDVMREAHRMKMTTSATMMFGHIETLQERIEHLALLRGVQAEKPADSEGFTAFIPWPFQDSGTVLQTQYGVNNDSSAEDYVRLLAISRIMLVNFKNIQASWLTTGITVGQLCLHGGANDLGSIMIEENVVSAAGVSRQIDAERMQEAIRAAGFMPRRRNQQYQYIE